MKKPTFKAPNAAIFTAVITVLLIGFIIVANEFKPEFQADASSSNPESVERLPGAERSNPKLTSATATADEPLIILTAQAENTQGSHILASAVAPLPTTQSLEKQANTINRQPLKSTSLSAQTNYGRRVIPSPSPDQQYQIYVVRPNDTITGIAHRQLRSYQRWREIASINADLLTNPNRLKPGMRLRIPIQTPASQDTFVFPNLPKHYIIQSGDTLGSLAQRFYNSSSKWAYILEANHTTIKDETSLQIGTTLIIPRP